MVIRKSIELYSWAIEYEENNSTLYNKRGLAKINLGKSEGVIIDFDKAVKLNPKNADAYYNRGVAKYALDDKKAHWPISKKQRNLTPKLKSYQIYYRLMIQIQNNRSTSHIWQ